MSHINTNTGIMEDQSMFLSPLLDNNVYSTGEVAMEIRWSTAHNNKIQFLSQFAQRTGLHMKIENASKYHKGFVDMYMFDQEALEYRICSHSECLTDDIGVANNRPAVLSMVIMHGPHTTPLSYNKYKSTPCATLYCY
jgi:hypothetical protein